MATPNEPDADDLAESLRRYVTAWVARVGPRVRDEMCVAAINIRLDQPQGEEDGTLYLDYTIDETSTADRSGGRVTGQRFDPNPAPRAAGQHANESADGFEHPVAMDAVTGEAGCHRLFDALLELRRANPLTSIQLHGLAEAQALRSWAAARGLPVVDSPVDGVDTVEFTPPDSAAFGWMVVAHFGEPPAEPPLGEVAF